jgi:adenylate cyclase
MRLFEELKRRNVFRVGIAYGVAAWLLLQVTDIVTPILQLPDSIPRIVLFLLVIGFIPAAILAWAFEMTPEGVKLESEVDRSKSITTKTGRTLDRAIIVVLVVAISFLLVDKFLLQNDPHSAGSETHSISAQGTPGNPQETPVIPANAGIQSESSTAVTASATDNTRTNTEAPAQAKNNSVAVLPFVAMSNGPDDNYFSDGLTEEIINALAQLPELLVTARTSAFHFKGRNIPVTEIARQLGVDHIVEGSVRRAGEQLRITAQLVRASDGFHLWSESYDRRTEDTLAVQADIAEKVAAALNVLLDDEQRSRMKRVGIQNVEAYTAYQKGQELLEESHELGINFSLLRQANAYFEQAFGLVPDFFRAHAGHADLYVHTLLTHANGQLDGNISERDLQDAPAALKQDYVNAIKAAKNQQARWWAEFDMALTFGEWRGLSSRANRTLEGTSCQPAFWSQLATGPFGQARLLVESFSRLSLCDPVNLRGWVHIAYGNLWMGKPEQTIEATQPFLKITSHPWVISAYATALAAVHRTEDAEKAINSLFRGENSRLFALTMLAAQSGNSTTAEALQEEYLASYGPDDYSTLMLEAARGRRNEANRLAGLIDRRPFGYMTLMEAIYFCTCGAPFDLEATPVFASMLAESGLAWPPVKPIQFPLKDW